MKPPLLCKELVNKQEDVKHIKGVLYSTPVVVESLQYITGLLFSSSNKIPEVKKGCEFIVKRQLFGRIVYILVIKLFLLFSHRLFLP